MQHIYDNHKQFVRFCIVGVLCTILDAAILYILRTFIFYQAALICSYLFSLIVNYILTIYWTFDSHPNKRNAVGIISAHIFNLFVVRMGIIWFLTNIMMIIDSIAYIPTIIISTCTNLLINKFLVQRSN